MSSLFAVGLLAFEVVNSRGDGVARFLAGANGVNIMADHQQHLKRHHHFVVFHVVADEHQNLLFCHGNPPPCYKWTAMKRSVWPACGRGWFSINGIASPAP